MNFSSLGGRHLAFRVDANFNSVVGLIVISSLGMVSSAIAVVEPRYRMQAKPWLPQDPGTPSALPLSVSKRNLRHAATCGSTEKSLTIYLSTFLELTNTTCHVHTYLFGVSRIKLAAVLQIGSSTPFVLIYSLSLPYFSPPPIVTLLSYLTRDLDTAQSFPKSI
ncbi:hypothetical protein B0H16DRAFT_775937 [Mycena metata]|uniref:Uncharacterized protein n=1 Tax=Mycena metata TaxID=1033252 RepID=A0AAD7IYJ5_9AGAR|nr:hypothetical protein B0H16DRAFT_775937 [Mycena metata]